ncbi:hypothetical protein ASwh1_283 [Aeromonas phage Aswh_1]|nr:hypothetical protein ASwh1_283 [Aeromonas phage Aswh_1]
MSSGKATLRSTAKHARRQAQNRRCIKKFLLGVGLTGKSEGLKDLHSYFDSGHISWRIRHIKKKLIEHLNCNNFGASELQFKFVKASYSAEGSDTWHFVVLPDNHKRFGNFLNSLNIRWSFKGYGQEIIIPIIQELEDKPVKYRQPKIEISVGVVGDSVVSLMKHIDELSILKVDLSQKMVRVDNDIRIAKQKLSKIMTKYL